MHVRTRSIAVARGITFAQEPVTCETSEPAWFVVAPNAACRASLNRSPSNEKTGILPLAPGERTGLTVPTTRVFESSIVRIASTALAFAIPVLAAMPVGAQSLPPVSVGAGLRTSFVHTEPEAGDGTDAFALNDIRLYVSGSVTDKIKIMFNTDYTGATNDVNVLDAAGQIGVSDKFNIWFGRFLPPSDRANLYGPFYSHNWAVYTDSVQDGYPFIYQGRANGAMYWGQFGKVKLSGGVFDGGSLVTLATPDDTVLLAGRAQVDFWDAEGGYYLNGTYYGDKNLLAIAVAGQQQGEDKSAVSADFLLERKVSGGGAYTVEAEWVKYDLLSNYTTRYSEHDGAYILGAFLFPQLVGPGRFEILGKYAGARFREGISVLDPDYTQKTSEMNLNYVIKQFNARVMMFYKDTRYDAVKTNDKQFGVGLQLQM
jgi:hypothetical protein